MTPEELAVLGAARLLAFNHGDEVELLGRFGQRFTDAVHALTPPEPPIGAVVLDRDGDRWHHMGGGWATSGLPTRSWEQLINDWGPVTRLFLAAEVAELVAALRGDSRAICRETHDGPVDSCPIPSCSDRRALLARFGEAS